MIEFISQPWHWFFGGLMLALMVILMYLAGERFGISTTFDTICSLGGAGRWFPYFRTDWRTNSHQFLLAIGTIAGGFIASHYLASPEPVQVAEKTMRSLSELGIHPPQTYSEGTGFIPEELFTFKNLLTIKGFILMVGGGFLIGFGTRLAGGCTSGHAITGLSNLQLGSLIAVLGFFAGGLIATHLLFPLIFKL